MNLIFKKTVLATLLSTATLLTACGGGSSSSDDAKKTSVDMPKGLTLAFVDASSPKYYSFNTTTEALVNLNGLAASSGDSAIQKLALNDTSVIGSFFHWPDFRSVSGVDKLDSKYLLMKPGYVKGATISSADFVHLVHFHGTDLAAHSADEFTNPAAGSSKEAGLARMNGVVTAQKNVEVALAAALPAGETLCRGYVDPYQAFELAPNLMHFALTESGKLYFYKDVNGTLVSQQGYVVLNGVSSVANCDRTTIARASDDGVLVFVPDAQKVYLVDSHGADYHVHSNWSVSKILGSGFYADMMAVIGKGADH